MFQPIEFAHVLAHMLRASRSWSARFTLGNLHSLWGLLRALQMLIIGWSERVLICLGRVSTSTSYEAVFFKALLPLLLPLLLKHLKNTLVLLLILSLRCEWVLLLRPVAAFYKLLAFILNLWKLVAQLIVHFVINLNQINSIFIFD